MSTKSKIGIPALLLCAAALLFSATLIAQNFRAEPVYGYIDLSSGFSPDPMSFDVTAGGSADVSRDLNLPAACEGFIHAGAPDLSLNYEAGEFPLQIYVNSTADTTLIINDPLGQWQCDDDSIGVNPAKRFASPPSGQYDIWVGTFDRQRVRARLFVTEK